MVEMSRRANYMLAWRLFSPFGDLQDLARERLHQHDHHHETRLAKRGDLVQQVMFPSFMTKGAKMYNEVRHLVGSVTSKIVYDQEAVRTRMGSQREKTESE
jgi:hypothetical protein